MDIVLASRNRKKIAEMQELLAEFAPGGVKVLSLDDIGLRGEIEENGNSFEENSFIKACAAARLGYFGIADDSGLCVDALGGRPGIFSARYSGENANDRSNNAKLLSELENVPDSERGAHFVCVVTCALPQSMSDVLIPAEYAGFSSDDGIRSFYVRGEAYGSILRAGRGESGFGYDPLFLSEEKNRTLAELTDKEKNGISHRGKAMRAFCGVFADSMKGKQRAMLRRMANGIDTIFQIGKNGISEETLTQVSAALEARELIKLRVLETAPCGAREAASEIAEALGADVVSVIGYRFVLYRRSEKKKDKIVLE